MKNFLSLIFVLLLNVFFINTDHDIEIHLIYILIWANSTTFPFPHWSTGSRMFQIMNCEYQNCSIIKDVNYFRDTKDYDVILFNGEDIFNGIDNPETRKDDQLFIFFNLESAMNFPINDYRYNWFFNYTWTYKLDSDIVYSYFIIRDINSDILGPKINIDWIEYDNMGPVSEDLRSQLATKQEAAVWFVSNCWSSSSRLKYIHNLKEELKKYNLDVHIYGQCGDLKCPNSKTDECLQMVESHYYFYMAFENSFSVDYVTEKLLRALDHYAVPIVYGGANYSRFVPEGSYLQASYKNYTDLAAEMNDIIQDKERYYGYFKWRKYYSYHSPIDTAETDPLCTFCAFLHNASVWRSRRVIANFSRWWNEPVNLVKIKEREPPFEVLENSYINEFVYSFN